MPFTFDGLKVILIFFIDIIIYNVYSLINFTSFMSNLCFYFKHKSFYMNFGLVGRVFENGPGDLSSIPGRVIPKTLKKVLYTSLLNSQQ